MTGRWRSGTDASSGRRGGEPGNGSPPPTLSAPFNKSATCPYSVIFVRIREQGGGTVPPRSPPLREQAFGGGNLWITRQHQAHPRQQTAHSLDLGAGCSETSQKSVAVLLSFLPAPRGVAYPRWGGVPIARCDRLAWARIGCSVRGAKRPTVHSYRTMR